MTACRMCGAPVAEKGEELCDDCAGVTPRQVREAAYQAAFTSAREAARVPLVATMLEMARRGTR